MSSLCHMACVKDGLQNLDRYFGGGNYNGDNLLLTKYMVLLLVLGFN